ncbi:MAG: hypothetical protein GY861_20405 [bacterium]|nr:hypothetical protein [bacterium]
MTIGIIDVIILVIVMFVVDFSKLHWILSYSKREITTQQYGQVGVLVVVSTVLTVISYLLVVDIVEFVSNNVIRFLM